MVVSLPSSRHLAMAIVASYVVIAIGSISSLASVAICWLARTVNATDSRMCRMSLLYFLGLLDLDGYLSAHTTMRTLSSNFLQY